MYAARTDEQRRAELEQLWADNRYQFLAEYCRIVGQPANDPTMSLKSIIDCIIASESATVRQGH